jgi:Pectate lyase superfamily protein
MLLSYLLFNAALCQTGSNSAAVLGTGPSFPTGKTELLIVSSSSSMQGDVKCTGTNDQLIINSAIAYFASSATGGTVTLSDGTFTIGNQILLTSNLLFRGQGMKSTTIMTGNNAGPFRNAGTIRGVNVTNLVLRDFTGNGNKLNNLGDSYDRAAPAYGKFGFYCETCTNVVVYRVGLVSYTGYGFDPHGKGGAYIYSEGLIIDSCYARYAHPYSATTTGTGSRLIKSRTGP